MPAFTNASTLSRARSRNLRDVMMCFIPASSTHASIVGMPDEKFSMAGTLPSRHKARMTTGVVLTLGNNRPTRSPPETVSRKA